MVTWVVVKEKPNLLRNPRIEAVASARPDEPPDWSIQHDDAERLKVQLTAQPADVGYTIGFIQLVMSSVRRGTYQSGAMRIVELPGPCLDGCRNSDDEDITPWYDAFTNTAFTEQGPKAALTMEFQDRPELRLPKVCTLEKDGSPLVKAYAKEEFLLSLVMLATGKRQPEEVAAARVLGQWTWSYEYLCNFSGRRPEVTLHREQHLQPVEPPQPLALGQVLLGPAGAVCDARWIAPPPAVQTAQTAATDCREALFYAADPATR
jgi:hypothetical protein